MASKLRFNSSKSSGCSWQSSMTVPCAKLLLNDLCKFKVIFYDWYCGSHSINGRKKSLHFPLKQTALDAMLRYKIRGTDGILQVPSVWSPPTCPIPLKRSVLSGPSHFSQASLPSSTAPIGSPENPASGWSSPASLVSFGSAEIFSWSDLRSWCAMGHLQIGLDCER